MAKNKGGLGRGLSALIPDWDLSEDLDSSQNEDAQAETIETASVSRETSPFHYIPIDRIRPNPYQPRQAFDEENLAELAASIQEQGILSPLLVVERESDDYLLVSGERRLRAAKRAGLKEVPVLLRELSDRDMAQIALIENIQREDLLAMEEAQAYADLMEGFGLTAQELAQRVGKSRSYVANSTRLLQLPEQIQAYLQEGKLSAGHGRALLGLEYSEDQIDLADEIIRKSLSVRVTEEAVKNIRAYDPLAEKASRERYKTTSPYKDLAGQITDLLQTQVKIKDNGKQGRLEIAFYGEEDLKRILDALGIESY